jgi:hypothetical protein
MASVYKRLDQRGTRDEVQYVEWRRDTGERDCNTDQRYDVRDNDTEGFGKRTWLGHTRRCSDGTGIKVTGEEKTTLDLCILHLDL